MEPLKESAGHIFQGVSMTPITINNALCVRSRFVRSGCRECIDACPQDAITIEGREIKVNGSCNGCNGCIPACPNGAIYSALSAPAIKKIEETKGNQITFVCRKYKGGNGLSGFVKVECIGGVELPDILAGLERSQEVIIALPGCGNCENRKAMRGFRRIVNSARSIISMTKMGMIRIVSTDSINSKSGSKKSDSVDLDRRQLFSFIAKKSINIKVKENRAEEARRQGMNRARALLYARLSARRQDLHGELPEGIPSGEISIDGTKCFGCNVCEHVCPGGAIKRVEKEEQVSIMFNPTWCTACNACVSACLAGAVTLKRGLKWDKFLDNQEQTLVNLTQTLCSVCGIDFFASPEVGGNLLCPRCKQGVIQEVRI
jgi:ferredoxin